MILKDIEKLEENINIDMIDSAKKILNISIEEICKPENNNVDVIMSVLHIQISLELFIKSYIITKYGFDEILTNKYKNIKKNSKESYLDCLKTREIRTLGFEGLKDLLKEKEDEFSCVVKKGITPFFSFEVDYLDGVFDKFQDIRNKFVHLGICIDGNEAIDLNIDFSVMVILFISIILREISDNSMINKDRYGERVFLDEDIFSTPIDILKIYLPENIIEKLLKNKYFISNIVCMAEDIDDLYTCWECGERGLILNIQNFPYGGFSKCFICGNTPFGGYADCNICKNRDTVIYDSLNISSNNNVMLGHCCNCNNKIKVYRCPVCGIEHSYDDKNKIDYSNSFECCENNFKDRPIYY